MAKCAIAIAAQKASDVVQAAQVTVIHFQFGGIATRSAPPTLTDQERCVIIDGESIAL